MKPCPHCRGSGQVADDHRLGARGAVTEGALGFLARLMPGMEFSAADLRAHLAGLDPKPSTKQVMNALIGLRRRGVISHVGHGVYLKGTGPAGHTPPAAGADQGVEPKACGAVETRLEG